MKLDSENDKDKQCSTLIASIKEAERLEKLSPLELVKEVLGTESADNFAVEELMNRVCPGWEEIIYSENDKD